LASGTDAVRDRFYTAKTRTGHHVAIPQAAAC
jgi:hypothetical protein